MHIYCAHGLTIHSTLPLALPAADGDDGGAADITIRTGDPVDVGHDDPPGELLAKVDDSALRVHYTFARSTDGVTLRYPGLAEWTGDAALSQIVGRPHPGVDAALLGVLGSGAVLATHLLLAGHLVLHASAVEVAGRAVAVVGASGMGKSTLATLLCGRGNSLVSDDVLRVAIGQDEIEVFAGATETRLREKAMSLAASVDPLGGRETADRRLAARPTVYGMQRLPLGCCVVPYPSREAKKVEVERMRLSAALRTLLQFPRLMGWREQSTTVRNFEALGALVTRVPVFRAVLPWGPPFHSEVAEDLLTAVGMV